MLKFFKKSDLKVCSFCQERFTREQDRDKCEKKHFLIENIKIERQKEYYNKWLLKNKAESLC
jgi:hypothetical protein